MSLNWKEKTKKGYILFTFFIEPRNWKESIFSFSTSDIGELFPSVFTPTGDKYVCVFLRFHIRTPSKINPLVIFARLYCCVHQNYFVW